MADYTASMRATIQAGPTPFGTADQILSNAASYDFDLCTVQHFDQAVREEIREGVRDLRCINDVRAVPHLRTAWSETVERAIHGEDPVERDQAVWSLLVQREKEAIEPLMASIAAAPTQRLKISALLALHKVAHHEPDHVAAFLNELVQGDSDVEIMEWARLHLHEMLASGPEGPRMLVEPASDREFLYRPGERFDTTMPLIFHCHAYTRIGPATLHTVVSPEWFKQIFGDAMACVRQPTYMTNLVLEKNVGGLHADGSAHFEHFPFSGSTQMTSEGVYRHNYWAQLHRPFYTSGRTEIVDDDHPVIQGVPMTFNRVAATYAPAKYRVNDQPIPESVRGMFFGYGHIEPRVLMERGMKMKVGDFQLSSRNNPETGQRANTYFYGTFFGKMSDWDGDGKLDVNTRPVHCDELGRLDYRGDGTMQPDPVRPEDWTGTPAV